MDNLESLLHRTLFEAEIPSHILSQHIPAGLDNELANSVKALGDPEDAINYDLKPITLYLDEVADSLTAAGLDIMPEALINVIQQSLPIPFMADFQVDGKWEPAHDKAEPSVSGPDWVRPQWTIRVPASITGVIEVESPTQIRVNWVPEDGQEEVTYSGESDYE